NAVVTATGFSGVYDASAHGIISHTVTGVAGDASATGAVWSSTDTFTNVPGGTANWHLAGGTNYNDQDGTAAVTITKANAVVTATGFSGTYDAAAHGIISHTVTGVTGDLAAAGAVWSSTDTFTNVPGGTANWHLAGGTNYNDQDGTAAVTITKANAVVTATGFSGTYDAAAHGIISHTVTGVTGDLAAAGAVWSSTDTFTNVPGGTANWHLAGGTNYNDQDGTAAVTITKANAVVTATGFSGTYDAAAHGIISHTVTGVTGDLAAAGAVWTSTDTFTNVPGGTANWHLAGGTNYNDQDGTAAVTITKANAVVTANGFSGTYDAAAHGIISHTVTGVTGDLAAAGAVWTSTDTFTNVPGGTANWHLAGGTNYN